MTRPRTQFPANAPRSQYAVEYVGTRPAQGETVSAYLDRIAGEYRRGCYLEDLTCLRIAAVRLAREVRLRVGGTFTYRQARQLLAA